MTTRKVNIKVPQIEVLTEELKKHREMNDGKTYLSSITITAEIEAETASPTPTGACECWKKQDNCPHHSRPDVEDKKLDLRTRINSYLWYAHGNIEPTSPEMERMVNTIEALYADLLLSRDVDVVKEIRAYVSRNVFYREDTTGALLKNPDELMDLLDSIITTRKV